MYTHFLRPTKISNTAAALVLGTVLLAACDMQDVTTISPDDAAITAAVVSHLTVTPREKTMEVGERARLQAAGIGRMGQEVDGLDFEWVTGDESVATVDEEGNVTAESAGETTVTARVPNRQASARIVVTEGDGDGNPDSGDGVEPAAPPPNAGQYPNEPAGFQRVLEHDMSCVPGSGGCQSNEGNWGSWGTLANMTVRNSGPAGTEMEDFVRGTFPAGQPGGSAPMHYAGIFRNAPQRDVYISTWMRIPTETFEHHPVHSKQLYLSYGSRRNTNWGTFNLRHNHNKPHTFYRASGGGVIASESRPHVQLRQSEDHGSTPFNTSDVTFPHQQWNHVEIHFRMSDIDVSNGFMKVWVNGNLAFDIDNLRTRFTRQARTGTIYNDRAITELRGIPVWGGVGRVKTRDDYIDYGHYYVSGVASEELSAPSGFAATAESGRNTLNWRVESTRHDGFDVFRWRERDGYGSRAWERIERVSAGATSYEDTDVRAGEHYQYHIRAVNGTGESLPTPNRQVRAR